MRSILSVLFVVFTYSILLAQNWELIEDKNDISLYKSSGDELDMYRAETMLQGKINDVIDEIYTFENYINWIDECVESRLVDTTIQTSTRIYGYSINATPWPLKDIDNYFSLDKNRMDKNNCEIKFESLPSFKPKQEKYIRLEISRGSWILEQISESEVKLTYYSEFQMPIKLPPFIVNNALKKSAMTLIEGVRSNFK